MCENVENLWKGGKNFAKLFEISFANEGTRFFD